MQNFSKIPGFDLKVTEQSGIFSKTFRPISNYSANIKNPALGGGGKKLEISKNKKCYSM